MIRLYNLYILVMELLLCLASHKGSAFSCLTITRILHFPSSAHRLQPTQATFSPPTTHPLPACVSILAPLHSNFPQMGTELGGRALSIQCVKHSVRQSHPSPGIGGSEVELRDMGVVVRAGGWRHHTPYLSWQCKRETAANE